MEGNYGSTAVANALAQASGFLCWTIDPAVSNTAAIAGLVRAGAVYLAAGETIATLAVGVSVAGAALTHGQLGIYDANFNLLAETADTPAVFQATGWVALPLTVAFVVPKSGLYYLAATFSGTTGPTLLGGNTNSPLSYPAAGGKNPRAVANNNGGALPNPLVPSTSSFCPLIVAY